ncbi:uncharacterized protein CAALFM_C400920CA, partial [Candida albicans SC5314]
MPPKSLKLIKKGLNPPVQDNKTFNSLFKEALNSPEHFLCDNLSNFKLPSDIDFFIGFIETKQFETWLDIISRQNNWTRNKRVVSSIANNNNEQIPCNSKKSAYLEELYYNCCSSGKYESKMQKGPGARYKNAVPTTIRTGCPAKWYAKKPKSMPNHWLVGVIPKHNHKNLLKGGLNRSARLWLKQKVEDGHNHNYIKKLLIDIHAQRNRGTLSDESLPLLNIQTHHILYLLRKKFNKQYKLNRGGRENLLAWGESIKKHGFFKIMDFPGLSTEGKPLWGCMFMDKKQKNILETNQDVWYL